MRLAAPRCGGSGSQSFAWRDACKALGIKHIGAKPYTPRTNGNAERFIQSALREWAYAKAYQNSGHRAQELPTGYTITIGTGPMPG